MVTLMDNTVEFAFFRPHAQNVHVVGDFNDWQHNLPMERSNDGYWSACIDLPAGEFKFKYCADGEWFTDYAAFGVEPGQFGMDSIVRVPHRTLKVSSQDTERAAVTTTAATRRTAATAAA